MTKKQQKEHIQKVQTLKEMVLITVGFQLVWEMIETKTSEKDRQSRDYTLAKHICNQLAYRIKTYRSLQKEMIDLWDKTREQLTDGEHNPFLAGLAMLATHMEIKNKRINIGLNREIIELQDLAFEFFDSEAINKSADWAEQAKKVLKV